MVDDSLTVKFFYINWVGEAVKPMTKGRVSTHKGAAEEFFDPFHIKITATNFDEINEEIIADKLQRLKGFKKKLICIIIKAVLA